jgi:hypothetical protein
MTRASRTAGRACVAVLSAGVLVLTAVPSMADTGTDEVADAALAVAQASPSSEGSLVPTPSGSGFVAEGAGGSVDFPDAATGAVEITGADGATVSFSLPEEAAAGEAVLSDGETVVYPGAVDVTVEALDPSTVQVATVIPDEASAHEFTYRFGDGVVPELESDGSARLIDESGAQIGAVAPPWAVDADGAEIATSYRVDGDALVQTVSAAEGTVYPVVADPTTSIGVGFYYHFNRAETRTWAGYGAAGTVGATAGCAAAGGLGGPIVAVVVGAACAKIAGGMIHAAGVANNSRPAKCFYTRVIPGTGIAGVTSGTYNDKRCK